MAYKKNMTAEKNGKDQAQKKEAKTKPKMYTKIPFYEDGYIPFRQRELLTCDKENPAAIYQFLKSRVHRQEDYCKTAAMILYNHLRGITSRNVVCGPPGSGKTYVWQCLREIYPNIIIVDASTITKEGWKGDSKVTGFTDQMDLSTSEYIIVFDEFDKLAKPAYSNNENVSAAMQSEFLKLIEGTTITVKEKRDTTAKIDTSKMTFVLCGSFAEKANEIAKKNTTSSMGFLSEAHEERPFDRELQLRDLVEFGVIPEIASRITRVINIRPLTEEDFCYLIRKHPNSPVKVMERQYGLKIRLSDKRCTEIASEVFAQGLGVRGVYAYLQRIIDAEIFLAFEKNKPRKTVTIS